MERPIHLRSLPSNGIACCLFAASEIPNVQRVIRRIFIACLGVEVCALSSRQTFFPRDTQFERKRVFRTVFKEKHGRLPPSYGAVGALLLVTLYCAASFHSICSITLRPDPARGVWAGRAKAVGVRCASAERGRLQGNPCGQLAGGEQPEQGVFAARAT